MAVIRTKTETPDKDLVGAYLDAMGRTPLLDAEQEVELSKAIEAGLYAERLRRAIWA